MSFTWKLLEKEKKRDKEIRETIFDVKNSIYLLHFAKYKMFEKRVLNLHFKGIYLTKKNSDIRKK